MADYTTLNIINKLLLEKMEQLENDNKELKNNYERLEKKARTDYNELYTLKKCVDLGDVVCCIDCIGKMWYSYEDTTSVGDYYVCDNCYLENEYFECDGCNETYGDDEEHMKIRNIKSKCPSNDMDNEYYDCDLCENCWDKERKRRHKVLMMELISLPSF